MSEDLQHIDALFKQGLGDAKLSPPDGLFEQCVQQFDQAAQLGGGTLSQVSWWSSAIKSPLAWLGTAAVVGVSMYVGLKQDADSAAVKSEQRVASAEAKSDEKASSNGVEAPNASNRIAEEDGSVKSQAAPEVISESQAKLERVETKDPVVVGGASAFNSSSNPVGQTDMKPESPKVSRSLPQSSATKPCGDRAAGWRPVISENVGGSVTLELNGNYQDLRIHWGDGEVTLLNGNNESNASKASHNYLVSQRKSFPVKLVNVRRDVLSKTQCGDSQRLNIVVTPSNEVSEVFAPDVFTPNGDGTNDVFFVRMPKPLNFDLTILDQNQRTVFRSNDYQCEWMGMYGNVECSGENYRVILAYKYSGDKEWKYLRQRLKIIR
jgi:hypothetical protein